MRLHIKTNQRQHIKTNNQINAKHINPTSKRRPTIYLFEPINSFELLKDTNRFIWTSNSPLPRVIAEHFTLLKTEL